MRAKDEEKLMAAGFSIVRLDRAGLRIKIKSGSHSWKTFRKCTSAAELDKAYSEVLKLRRVIEG